MSYVEKVLVRDPYMNGAVACPGVDQMASQILHNESFSVSFGLSRRIQYKASQAGFDVLVDCFIRQ